MPAWLTTNVLNVAKRLNGWNVLNGRRFEPLPPHGSHPLNNMPNKRRSPSDWTLTTPSTKPFGSQLAERAGAFGKLDAGLRTFA